MTSRLAVPFVLALALGCGGGSSAADTTTVPEGTPRPGGGVDLLTMVPANASVALHADLVDVRRDPAAYDRIASQLATELGLSADSATLRDLLDRTDEALGAFAPAGGRQEGMLIFSGRYVDEDFDRALAIAAGRHGSTPAPAAGADGRQIYALGNATVAKLDQWTWAVAEGEGMRAHLGSVALSGGARFSHDLTEFGPRIGLPDGSAQAWADQDQQVGVDMVALVFAGENPQMVHNFVSTVQRHLGL